MKRISIERYKTPVNGYSGLIEGETDIGEQWIMYIDQAGKPKVFWPQRAPDGAVVGDPIPLGPEWQGQFSGVFKALGVDSEEGVISTWPVWNDVPENGELAGMRGIVFAKVPGDGDYRQKMRTFLSALAEGWLAPDETDSPPAVP